MGTYVQPAALDWYNFGTDAASYGNCCRIGAGSCWVAELPDRALVLIASYNLYGRWTITIYDQKSQSNLFELHDEQTLEGARKYAEGYVNGAFHEEPGPFQWSLHSNS